MKKIPKGKLVTPKIIRKAIAKKYNVDVACPLTCGIFINIVAWASYQRKDDITPYWRTIKSDGELNVKYPEAIKLNSSLLIVFTYASVARPAIEGIVGLFLM